MRLNTELTRMKEFLQENAWQAYCSLSESEYSVSYLKYEDLQPADGKSIKDDDSDDSGARANIQVIVNNHPESVEEKMFSDIKHIETKTSVLANIATFIARVSGIKI